MGEMMTGYQSKKAAALDEDGMYLVHQTQPAQDKLEQWGCEAFNDWWDSDYDDSTNPYEKDTFAYWAWAGWQAALAQPAQKPVAWGVFEGNLHDMFFSQKEAQEMADLKGIHAEVRPLYTAPPQRPWVGLAPEEILDLFDLNNVYGSKWVEFARAVETKLKEKNNG
jgi:hypothetical protein